MHKGFDLNDIRIFVAAADAGTLSGAAADLHLPASSVSRSLTRLERHLGLLLVRRNQRGLTLTEAGVEYLQSCKLALSALHEGGELLARHRTHPAGLIRVACPITMARDLLAPLLGEFVRAFPDLRVELEPYSSQWDQEPKQDIDVFFKVRSPKDSSRRVRCYPGTLRGLFASREYVDACGAPAGPAELPAHRCIGSGVWRLRSGTSVVSPEINFQVVTSDPAVHRRLTVDGVGIAVLPLWMARHPALTPLLVPILPSWTPTPISLCALYRGQSGMIPKVQAFLDFLEGYIGTDRDPRLQGSKAKDCFAVPANRHPSRPAGNPPGS